MVRHFIGVYIINRTLHDRLEIRNFSSRVEKYFTRSLRSLVKYFSTLEEKFRISARPCNILYVCDPFSHYLISVTSDLSKSCKASLASSSAGSANARASSAAAFSTTISLFCSAISSRLPTAMAFFSLASSVARWISTKSFSQASLFSVTATF